MNKKHVGSSVMETIEQWEKDPAFKTAVEMHMEKAKLGMLMKQVRRNEDITQAELAEKAGVPQSVIARIETASSRTLPRLDLFNRILGSVGYKTRLIATKRRRELQVAF
jgi:DNA-binding XRE family transcriptional regulator